MRIDTALCCLFKVGFLHRLFNERLLDPTKRTHLGVFSEEWILNQVQDDVSGGGAEDEGSLSIPTPPSNGIQILNRVQNRQAIINDYHHLELCA